MKIREILSESEEWINEYWLLKSIDIGSYRRTFAALKERYAQTKDARINGSLVSLYSYLDELLRRPEWQYLENDPDYDRVYDLLLDLRDEINRLLMQ